MSTIKVTNIQNPSASNPSLVLETDGSCYQLGTRNVLINGNPMINQRGYVSGTATTGANEYTVDRWRVVTLGESITFSDSANVRTITAPTNGVEQVVEGLNLISGTYTLSWTGTATATVDGSSVTNGGQVTLTGGTNATVKFSGGTFSLAQLERGSVATPFEHRSYGDELARCQRYYQDLGSTSFGSATSLDATYANTKLLPVAMRATPTVSFTWAAGSGASIVGESSVAIRQSGTHSSNAFVTILNLTAEL